MPKSTRTRSGALNLAALTVLGVIGEGPTHGFAIVGLCGADGQLGHVWRFSPAVVYRELAHLVDVGLVHEDGVDTDGPGPARTIVVITPEGEKVRSEWLARPVQRARDVRSEFLLKLALLDRSNIDSGALLAVQREVMAQRSASLRDEIAAAAPGFERTLLLWRLTSTQAVVDFLSTVGAQRAGQDPR
ncbi:PadR family transcriptional regulator [Rudaeicoccus suwonensis]|uniref:PadR family transcriptional regulator n=1 Tax=Rudaeicoccus suwonensis TaxID=657409 RepID=A0A561E479_9MICO|nr:PadR family transcriptional regulator [Rudaeicoccus suwonensis]TWE10415.1 PadR family transcriptional regulator [Rudaeicoccus suwonensis]